MRQLRLVFRSAQWIACPPRELPTAYNVAMAMLLTAVIAGAIVSRRFRFQ